VKFVSFGTPHQVANVAADPNTTWNTAVDADTTVPKVLMMLPGGADTYKQVLTSVNTSAKIYLLMSENVSIANTAGVTIYSCGEYVVASVASGFSHAPLTSPDCTALSAQAKVGGTPTLTLLDNAYGSSVVEFDPVTELSVKSKYTVQIAAATFTDKAGNANAVQGAAETIAASAFEFFTEGSRDPPVVTRYVYDETRTTTGSGEEVLSVWFDMPVAQLAAFTVTAGLIDAGTGTADADVDSTLTCNGGFQCVVKSAAALAQDTVYLVKLPADKVYDRESDLFVGEGAAVSFKTHLLDGIAPRVAFCSDVVVGTTSLSLKLGFTEAIVLYDGYTSKTDSTNAYLAPGGVVATGNEKSVQMTLEAGGAVLSIESAEALAEGTTYHLFIDNAKLKDATGNLVAADINITDTTACATALLTGTSDSTAPSYTSVLPADAASTVHAGDHVVFTFSEEVAGAVGASLTLSKCGVASNTGSCNSAVAAETVAAVDLKFGGGDNAMWQITTELEQGAIYHVAAASGTFADLSGNAYASAHSSTFQVALEKWDYRSKATTHHADTVAYFDNGADQGISRLGVHTVDATSATTLKLYFAQTVAASSKMKVYFNATDHYYEVPSAAVDSTGKSLTLAIPAGSLGAAKTYKLAAYKDDVLWSTNVFSDADDYYTYFGNYKASTAYQAAYAQPEPASRFQFTTAAATSATYYGAPTLDADPLKVGWGLYQLNASSNVSTSAMIQVDLSAVNGPICTAFPHGTRRRPGSPCPLPRAESDRLSEEGGAKAAQLCSVRRSPAPDRRGQRCCTMLDPTGGLGPTGADRAAGRGGDAGSLEESEVYCAQSAAEIRSADIVPGRKSAQRAPPPVERGSSRNMGRRSVPLQWA